MTDRVIVRRGYSRKKWVVSKFVKYFKIRWFCVEKVKIEALKGKIFNFNENNENHKVYPSACGSGVTWNLKKDKLKRKRNKQTNIATV